MCAEHFIPDEYISVYEEINNGAHRKAADLIGAPSLIWHQAFWDSKKSLNGRKTRAQFIKCFVRDLRSHIGHIKNSGLSPTGPEINIEHDDRVRVLTFHFTWQHIIAKIRIEIHTEYLTLTSILDMSIDLSGKNFQARENYCNLSSSYKVLRESISEFSSEIASSSVDFPRAKNIHKTLYSDIWDSFFNEVLNVGDYFSVNPNLSDTYIVKIGKKFADFRGFITCERYPENADEQSLEDVSDPAEQHLENAPIQEPFYRKLSDEGARGQWHRVWVPTEKWARKRLDSVWPFLNFTGVVSPTPMRGRTEFTVSRLAGGRMIYASALGPQFNNEHEPVHFYIHSATQCERQIGRAVDRFCQLGTLRLAAILPIPALKDVRQTIWDTENRIKSTRSDIHNLIQQSRALIRGNEISDQDRLKIQGMEKDILDDLDEIHNTMGSISDGTNITKSQELGEHSIEYRLIRSRYYKDLFLRSIDGLRLKRLEGYQKYDEFVKRRLESAFGFIEGVERHLDEIKEEWRALDQLYLTTTVTLLTGEIDQQQRSSKDILANTSKAQEEIKDIQKEIKDIQKWGERFLLLFILPYYTIGTFFHVFGCSEKSWCSKPVYDGFFISDWEQIISTVILGAYLVAFFFRHKIVTFFLRHKIKEEK